VWGGGGGETYRKEKHAGENSGGVFLRIEKHSEREKRERQRGEKREREREREREGERDREKQTGAT